MSQTPPGPTPQKVAMIRACGLSEQADRITNGLCPTCGAHIDTTQFRDLKSIKEYGISGMCQECQDATFD